MAEFQPIGFEAPLLGQGKSIASRRVTLRLREELFSIIISVLLIALYIAFLLAHL
jgi:hypothetical protein